MLTHRHGILGFVFAALAALTGCPTPIDVDTGDDACAGDPLCITCTFDTDCPNDGVCSAGTCGTELVTGPTNDGGCTQTSDCPLDQMCNGSTGTCDALPAGWCRRDVDCAGAASLCSASSENVPGLCVECLADVDCPSGERCGAGGSCAGDGGDDCPANSSFSGGTCRCNAGFHLDSVTHTCESDTPTAGCVANAHPVPGQAGRCECDLGYESSAAGNSCVRPANGTPPPGTDPGTDPGDTGGDDDGGIFGNCGPNTIAVFFVCFCLPGFEPNPAGDIGCSEDTDAPADEDPPVSGDEDPTDPQPSTDVCEENGWYGDDVCDQFCANPDPDCDDPAAETPGAEEDVCQVNGWYGDDVCDEFCPSPDPDCDTTGTTPASDVCEENGWYGDGTCDTFCANPDPDCTAAADVCEENGWYGDDVCDDFCPSPDPDCDAGTDPPAGSGDVCAENGWYNDGTCDTFCPTADPDCDAPDDICEVNGWYSDMVCDTNCASPDPDCSDACVENAWYGDGVCDTFCPLADPDC